MLAVLLIHAAATWALVGLIWIVQLVHYPLFSSVGCEQFKEYHARHTQTITWIVAPLMFVELGTAIALVVGKLWNPWLLVSFVLLAWNWVSTWWIQIPHHRELASGFNDRAHRRLGRCNWLRTAAWSLRGVLVVLAVYQLAATDP